MDRLERAALDRWIESEDQIERMDVERRERALARWRQQGNPMAKLSPLVPITPLTEAFRAGFDARSVQEANIIEAAIVWRNAHRGAPLDEQMADMQKQASDALKDAIEFYLQEE